jgi:branched-chain amino acid transport system substrate-binding protein
LALGKYDAVMMTMSVIGDRGRRQDAEEVANALNTTTYKGVAMTYKSNGRGDMSHNAEIVCWDGASRIPKVVATYSDADMILK